MRRSRGPAAFARAAGAALALLAAAGPAGAAALPAPAAAFVEALALQRLAPTYRDFAADTAELARSVRAVCAPGADAGRLEAARRAWTAAYRRWRGLDALQFGPALALRSYRAIDAWPARPALIERGIGTQIGDWSETGAQARGLPAVEYLLWVPEATPEQTLAGLAGARCTYLDGAAGELAREAAALWQRWDVRRGGFALAVARPGSRSGSGAPAFADLRAVLGELVNRLVAGLETANGLRLSRPGGLGAHGLRSEAQPERFEAWRSGASRAGLLAHVQAIRSLVDGSAQQPGLAALLTEAGAADNLRAMAAAAEAAIAALPEPLAPTAASRREALEAAALALKALQKLIETELAPALGVTLDFNENDGD